MFAQKATYDLLTYTAPSDWTEEAAENTISYIGINKKTNTWCRIWIVKSTVSKGTIEADFENEWQELIVKNYQPTDSAQSAEIKEAGQGWKIKVGDAKFIFNNSDAVVMLTTMSGYNRCASIVVTTNSEDYIKDIEAFLASVDLNKPEIVTSTIEITNNNENSIIEEWHRLLGGNPP